MGTSKKKMMTTKRQATSSATAILRRVTGRSEKMRVLLDRERLSAAVARQICEARKDRGLSQAKLAAMVGTTQSVIARLEDADYDGHSLTMLRRIAEALGYDVEVRFVVHRTEAVGAG
jgi:ribosome-binding protein aMBF1 (putative translation factor)